MLKNAYFLAKIGADTAENEQHFAKILPIFADLHGGGNAPLSSGRVPFPSATVDRVCSCVLSRFPTTVVRSPRQQRRMQIELNVIHQILEISSFIDHVYSTLYMDSKRNPFPGRLHQ